MSKRKKETIKVKDSIENTLSQMPKYNPYQTGTGVAVSEKYKGRKGRKAQREKKELWNED